MIYLYVKQHNITGLKYFGTTRKRDPQKYIGSGSYWLAHIKKHGKDVSTLNVWTFKSQDSCTQFAKEFSQKNNIVESKEWANLIIEDGTIGCGFQRGRNPWNKGLTAEQDMRIQQYADKQRGKSKHSNETKALLSTISSQRTHSNNTKQCLSLMRKGQVGRVQTEEVKSKISAAKKGKRIDRSNPAKNQIPIIVEGIWYHSANEASRKTGISVYRLLKYYQ